jgi:phosphoribosylformylglycinamidine cyclo-ligase
MSIPTTLAKRTDRYAAAGVDIEAGDRTKARIGEIVASTRTRLARGLVGAFGGMVKLPGDIPDPVLVLSTDSLGTKALVAVRAGRHDTVGEDLVNHCVNDILVHGARPIAFLDCISCAELQSGLALELVEGVARGCRAHEMTLAGGESAQVPELFAPGHYDLSGTIVGVVSETRALHGDRVTPGDVLVGYESTGLHTNGYTLARKIVFEEQGLEVSDRLPGLPLTVGDALLAVHRSYWKAIAPALGNVHALAHITGGGIPGNLSRSLPSGCRAAVERETWPVPVLFRWLGEAGKVAPEEMLRVFNMGIGMIAVVPPEQAAAVRKAADAAKVRTWIIGEVVKGEGVIIR